MAKTVSRRECKEIMLNILIHIGSKQSIDREDNEAFFASLQPDLHTKPALLYLEAKGYLKLEMNPVSLKLFRISLTDKGRTYFEDTAQTRHEKQISRTQYAITTIISALALLLAVLSIVWQIYTWNIERSRSEETTSGETPSAAVLTKLQGEQSQQHLE